MIYKNFNSYYITIILFCLTINKTKNPPGRRIFCFIHQYYLSSQLLTSYVVALKNADSEFTE